MLTISAPCPRCLEPRTILEIVYADPPIEGPNNPRERETIFRCSHCLAFVIVRLEAGSDRHLSMPILPPNQNQALFAKLPKGDLMQDHRLFLSDILPHMPKDEIPESLPDPVLRSFTDGLELLKQKRWTAAAVQFRTAVERAVTLQWPADDVEAPPFKLDKRIQKLAEKLAMPTSLVDWAHAVRVVGNDVHVLDEIDEADARDTGRFCEMFLTYTFTLPERLKQFRARREGQAPAAANGVS